MSSPTAVISGQVVTSDGNPVANARLYFTAGPAPLPEIAALTDADGRFALGVSQPGTYQLSCSLDERGPFTETVEVVAGKPAQVTIRVAQ